MNIYYYPYDFPYSSSILMPSAKLGDSYQLNLRTTFKQSMDGTINSHIRKKSYKKLLNYVDILEIDKDNFESFYENYVGLEIKYKDHDDILWRGYFGMGSLRIETIRDNCSYNLTVEFIGSIA